MKGNLYCGEGFGNDCKLEVGILTAYAVPKADQQSVSPIFLNILELCRQRGERDQNGVLQGQQFMLDIRGCMDS